MGNEMVKDIEESFDWKKLSKNENIFEVQKESTRSKTPDFNPNVNKNLIDVEISGVKEEDFITFSTDGHPEMFTEFKNTKVLCTGVDEDCEDCKEFINGVKNDI